MTTAQLCEQILIGMRNALLGYYSGFLIYPAVKVLTWEMAGIFLKWHHSKENAK